MNLRQAIHNLGKAFDDEYTQVRFFDDESGRVVPYGSDVDEGVLFKFHCIKDFIAEVEKRLEERKNKNEA